ncbi:MAG TPA: hypothetical protein VFB90_08325, partial [Dehalococcoidia bacterium]|nr:hypothetical protein [Dehalococcoidia bacterium]
MTNLYDLASDSGRESAATRLGITIIDLAGLVERSGLPAGVVLEEFDLEELAKELLPVADSAHQFQRQANQTFRDSMVRARQQFQLVVEARSEVFGAPTSPFPGHMEEARDWIDAERQKLTEAEKPKSGGLVLAWPGKGDWQAYAIIGGDGPLSRLARWSERISNEARL